MSIVTKGLLKGWDQGKTELSQVFKTNHTGQNEARQEVEEPRRTHGFFCPPKYDGAAWLNFEIRNPSLSSHFLSFTFIELILVVLFK